MWLEVKEIELKKFKFKIQHWFKTNLWHEIRVSRLPFELAGMVDNAKQRLKAIHQL